MTVATAPSAPPSVAKDDPRLAAFLAADGREVFSAIVHASQVWTPDPFDVETIHVPAREAYARLLNRAAADPPPPSGKSLLLLGEAGSGKTHLMRAFRNAAHAAGTGYCGYMQMTTRASNYARYVLSKLVDSLEEPYLPPAGTPGLTRLAQGLLDALGGIPAGDRRRFCDEPLDPADLGPLVERFTDAAVQDARFAKVDVDLIRAVLYLLPPDGRIRPRVLKWLRCEDLAERDRKLLGDLVPRPQEEMPLRTIVGLGRLMAAVHRAALVVCVDQLEEMIRQAPEEEKPGELFRRAVDVLVAVVEEVPTAVVVVACLDDYYKAVGNYLTQPKHDRLAKDPEPITLTSQRSEQEIAALVVRRLEVLYGESSVAPDERNPTFPFRAEHFRPLLGMRTRHIIDYCRLHREACMLAGRWREPDGAPPPPPPPAPPKTLPLEQRWNDCRTAGKPPAFDDESQPAELLAWAIKAASAEMPDGLFFSAESSGRTVPVEVHGPGNAVERLLVGVCDKDARGNGLRREIEELAKDAEDVPPVFVRSTPFPKSPAAAVAKLLAKLVVPVGKGRRVVVEDADWRALAAFRAFHAKEQADPAFPAWQREGRPLSNLPAVRAILDLDRRLTQHRPAARPADPVTPGTPPPPAAPRPAPAPPAAGLRVGTTRAVSPARVIFNPQGLTQHAAFLGGPGSGKTTAALNLVEQLLALGVPAVLIDRKGDLCRYADPGAWEEPLADAAAGERRRALRDRLDVTLFTPGSAHGRPLSLPVVPPDLGQLPEADREQLAGYAAAAVGGMMGYKARGPDPKLAILAKAIEVLAQAPGGEVSIPALRRLVQEKDDALILAVDGFDDRHYKKLADDLHSLALTRKALFTAAEPLDIDALLGRGPHARLGKTRLSVVSTQFLGDAAEFWVAQLLIALDRWRTKNPSQQLQAVFLFDEADAYLPATRQPATKAPLENLLRRARSAGVGLLLATQSPGDLDYRCRDQIRTWLVGRVKERVALDKLKPMLEVARIDAAAKLPGQQTGEFYLLRESQVVPIQTERCLISTAQVPEDRILELARAGR